MKRSVLYGYISLEDAKDYVLSLVKRKLIKTKDKYAHVVNSFPGSRSAGGVLWIRGNSRHLRLGREGDLRARAGAVCSVTDLYRAWQTIVYRVH